MATAVLRLGLEAAALGRALAGTSRVRLPRAAPGVQLSRGLASSAAAKELQKTVRPPSPSSSSSSCCCRR